MKSHFSITISPDERTIEKIRVFKNQLKNKIGWYNSCNSEAHISICEFNMHRDQVYLVENQVEDFCRTQTSSEVYWNEIRFWENGTLCLLPDEASKDHLTRLMVSLKKYVSLRGTVTPHISIARGIEGKTNRDIARLWETMPVSIPMECDNITIREFDESTRQYKTFRKFRFSGAVRDTSLA